METEKIVIVFFVTMCVLSSCTDSSNNETVGNSAEINSTDSGMKSEELKTEHINTEGVSDTATDISETESVVSANESVISDTESVISDNEKDILDAGEVISDTGDNTPDAEELTPEDEDMVILKMRELGGILDPKDIEEIAAEEQMLEDLEETEDIPEGAEDLKFEPIPMPTDFDSYDRNGDNLIEMKELIDVTGAFENVEEAFKVCDSDDDGFIDRVEFKDAPWDLSGKPPEGGLEQL